MLLLKPVKSSNNDLVIQIHLPCSSCHYSGVGDALNYTCIHWAIVYKHKESNPEKMRLWEKKRHITNTKIKTLRNKVNTESKNWEWDKYWIKTNSSSDSNVNSSSAQKDWTVLTVEDERLKQREGEIFYAWILCHW